MEKESDEYCQKIFTAFLIADRKMRFNELYKEITKYGIKISKPTLIQHLRHLQNQKTIQRLQKDKQVVFYQLNWKRLEQLRKAQKIGNAALKYVMDEETFKSKPLHHQVMFTIDMLILRDLFNLKIAALFNLKPKQTLEYFKARSFINTVYTIYAKWLFKSASESQEDGQKILDEIDNMIDKMTEPYLKETLTQSQPTSQTK